MEHCSSCKWWRSVKSVLGECRGRAPIFADNAEDPRVWPYTNRHDWCGDHKPNEATPSGKDGGVANGRD